MEKVKIERPLYDQQQLHRDYAYQHVKKRPTVKSLFNSCRNCDPIETLKSTIPVLEWLPKYKWRTDFTSDFISGVTVAIMQISQGMAYGLLGNVPPVVGIYMAFFPVIIYVLLGHSRHNSMGTFAVTCLMTGKVVLTLEQDYPEYTSIEVVTAVCFTSAIIQLLMYIFRLGVVSSLLSETLVSGLTTGAAVHVLVSQIKDLFGISIPKQKGFFVNVLTVKDIILNVGSINYIATIISVITVILSVLNNEVFKPIVSKRSKIPVPMELIVIVLGTGVSAAINLKEDYGVKIIGSVPSGLPLPKVPHLELISVVWLDSLMIAIVAYTVSFSMALIFAQKLNYEVDANQELLAHGASNIVGSFFSCMPFSTSLSRSLIQESVGGKTQLVSIVASVILVVVLLWVGPYFETLPVAVLAGIIVVALKGMLMQVKDFFKFLSISKMDAAVWLVTFVSVAFIGIDIGLVIGIVMSLSSIFILGFKPYTSLLGWVPHTDLYLDSKRYKGVKELYDIKIFHYQGSINFASKNLFRSELYKKVNIYPKKELYLRNKIEKLMTEDGRLADDNLKGKLEQIESQTTTIIKCIVLDFSALSYIDSSGVTMLKSLSQEFQRIDIPIHIGGCTEPVYEMMCKCDLLNEKKEYYRVFPTIHDAVQHASSHCSSISNLSTITTMSRL